MQTKLCTKCHQEKNISEFHKQAKGKFGVRTVCKECYKSPRVKEKQSRLDLVPKGFKICSECKTEKPLSSFTKDKSSQDGHCYWCKDCLKLYRQQHAKYYKKKRRKFYLNNKELEIKRAIDWQNKNKEKVKQYRDLHWHEYYLQNKEIIKKRARDFTKNNRDYINNRLRIKRKTDINFKLKSDIRSRLNLALNGNQKSGHTLELLGCSVEFLKNHLESQFKEGMTWDNWSRTGWHIDHIYPLASFDLKKKSEQKIACNWGNLQPLWAVENRFKSDKI